MGGLRFCVDPRPYLVAGARIGCNMCVMRKPSNTPHTTVRLHAVTVQRVHQLADEIERATGIRPQVTSLFERVVADGAEVMRRRPALAVDTAPRKGDV